MHKEKWKGECKSKTMQRGKIKEKKDKKNIKKTVSQMEASSSDSEIKFPFESDFNMDLGMQSYKSEQLLKLIDDILVVGEYILIASIKNILLVK